jgi:hypothetical protein
VPFPETRFSLAALEKTCPGSIEGQGGSYPSKAVCLHLRNATHHLLGATPLPRFPSWHGVAPRRVPLPVSRRGEGGRGLRGSAPIACAPQRTGVQDSAGMGARGHGGRGCPPPGPHPLCSTAQPVELGWGQPRAGGSLCARSLQSTPGSPGGVPSRPASGVRVQKGEPSPARSYSLVRPDRPQVPSDLGK